MALVAGLKRGRVNMLNFRNIGRVGQALSGAITRLSSERAVQAQVRANGGAMNLSAQSSVQSQAEAARKERRDALIGHAAKMTIVAPDAPHLELSSEDPGQSPGAWPYRRRRSGGGQSGNKKRR